MVQFGSRSRAVETEIPSTSLRAGSSRRLKNGYAQDDTVGKGSKLHYCEGFAEAVAPVRPCANIWCFFSHLPCEKFFGGAPQRGGI